MSTVPGTAPGTTARGATAPGTTAPGTTAPGTTAPEITSPADHAERISALARELPAGRRPGWWGMVLALVSDVSFFASLIAGYFYIRFVTSDTWPPPGDPLPKLLLSTVMTVLLVVSAVPMAIADLGLKAGSRTRLIVGTLGSALLGAAFVVLEIIEWADELKTSWPTKDAYGSFFYALTGYHVVHIALGAVALLLFAAAALAGRVRRAHHIWVRVFAIYWYSSVVVWVLIYATLYWSVRS